MKIKSDRRLRMIAKTIEKICEENVQFVKPHKIEIMPNYFGHKEVHFCAIKKINETSYILRVRHSMYNENMQLIKRQPKDILQSAIEGLQTIGTFNKQTVIEKIQEMV